MKKCCLGMLFMALVLAFFGCGDDKKNDFSELCQDNVNSIFEDYRHMLESLTNEQESNLRQAYFDACVDRYEHLPVCSGEILSVYNCQKGISEAEWMKIEQAEEDCDAEAFDGCKEEDEDKCKKRYIDCFSKHNKCLKKEIKTEECLEKNEEKIYNYDLNFYKTNEAYQKANGLCLEYELGDLCGYEEDK